MEFYHPLTIDPTEIKQQEEELHSVPFVDVIDQIHASDPLPSLKGILKHI